MRQSQFSECQSQRYFAADYSGECVLVVGEPALLTPLIAGPIEQPSQIPAARFLNPPLQNGAGASGVLPFLKTSFKIGNGTRGVRGQQILGHEFDRMITLLLIEHLQHPAIDPLIPVPCKNSVSPSV